MLANTIWSPLIIYHYGVFAVWLAIAIGFAVELLTVWFYTRKSSPFPSTLRSIAIANLLSYLAGNLLFFLIPFDVHKNSLRDLTFAFVIAYIITVFVEWCVLSRRIAAPRSRVIQAVLFSNFYSYAILFSGYLLWWFGWSRLMQAFNGRA
jgi:hypothetical protein